jgi:hypothetical protein
VAGLAGFFALESAAHTVSPAVPAQAKAKIRVSNSVGDELLVFMAVTKREKAGPECVSRYAAKQVLSAEICN